MNYNIPYYSDYLSEKMKKRLLEEAKPLFGIEGLSLVGESGGLENKESLEFLVSLYEEVHADLAKVLNKRIVDRKFIDEKTLSLKSYNDQYNLSPEDLDYKTVLGLKDEDDRIVIGPYDSKYMLAKGEQVAPIPDYLQGFHVTLFGPPDSEKMCINAMNAFHRKLKNEPTIVSELVSKIDYTPKWGADNEDSKTPMHSDLKAAGINLSQSLDHEIEFKDQRGKEYKLADSHLSHAIKRFPGLALPSLFMFYQNEPIPLHLYDFALHAYKNHHNPEALVFYVPKLENEEEAKYIHKVMSTAEKLIQKKNPNYKLGTIRLMIVLENPRAVFRVNEIIDNLYPYFVGASLGWHDYLGSTARLFKNDPHYRIPVKADPDIVIKYIKASHDLLSDVVGERGGIKVGGMYGILPITYDLESPSLQVTILGYIRDVITQLKRNLNGFWVAHPDFVRIGMAIVEAWKIKVSGDDSKLEQLVKSLLDTKYHQEIMDFINGPDIEGLNQDDPMYAKSLIVADVGESNIIANNDPKEIRYNVFQSLQYITDWLSGNGCVALPTVINNTAVRIMDDLATAERSRWEVWHELYHNRFDLHEFLKIAHEEMHYIRKDLEIDNKIVQVKLNEENKKWYPVAFNLMVKLMTDIDPAEFATELLLPFTIDEIRNADDPWAKALEIDAEKFHIDEKIRAFNYYFEICGELDFAKTMSLKSSGDLNLIENTIKSFSVEQIIQAASFHGDIGQSKKGLDKMALAEQSGVTEGDDIKNKLLTLGKEYKEKFGFKFLVSAQGKSGQEMLEILESRFQKTRDQEINEARKALFEITKKRFLKNPYSSIKSDLSDFKKKFNVPAFQVAYTKDNFTIESIFEGLRDGEQNVDESTFFEIASLSKTVGSTLAIEYFKSQNIQLDSSVNKLLRVYGSSFQIISSNPDLEKYCDEVNLMHLMGHCALNMHYVNGIPSNHEMPAIDKFLNGNKDYGYIPIELLFRPGSQFQYSGAGFIVLEYLIELISGKKFATHLKDFLDELEIEELSAFESENLAYGYRDSGEVIESNRLNFPTIAAGMMGSAFGMQKFLIALSRAYQNDQGFKNISHDTAVKMLYGVDRGSRKFMNCDMGLGVFTSEAGLNKLMIHQGANDGYRTIFVHCFEGPDVGKGFSVFSNSELNAVFFNATVAQRLFQFLDFSGIDFSKFESNFENKNLKQEEIVNRGYKELVFDAFKADQSELYERDEVDPLLEQNLLKDAQVLYVSNDKFAPVINLISKFSPVFDPAFFGRQGKVMDSWESARHNFKDFEEAIFELYQKGKPQYIYLSTKYHDGNQVEFVEVQSKLKTESDWKTILTKTHMEGHSFQYIKLPKVYDCELVRVLTYPDGGLTRLALLESLDESLLTVRSTRFDEVIPKVNKPINLSAEFSQNQINENLSRIETGKVINIACSSLGAKVLKASNEHYAPASNVISPYKPINMFDGFENARSRQPGNVEEIEIQLAMNRKIEYLKIDFTYFVNNNPVFIEIDGFNGNEWITLVEKDWVKPYRGKFKKYPLFHREIFERLKVRLFPDGGVNRIQVYARK